MDPKVAKADAKHEKLHSQKRKKDNSERKTTKSYIHKKEKRTIPREKPGMKFLIKLL